VNIQSTVSSRESHYNHVTLQSSGKNVFLSDVVIACVQSVWCGPI